MFSDQEIKLLSAVNQNNLAQIKENIFSFDLSKGRLENGYVLLCLACLRNFTEIAEYLLTKGCNINRNSYSLLIPAENSRCSIEFNRVKSFEKYLTDLFPYRAAQFAIEVSPLHWAVIKKNKELCELLVKYKADVNVEDKEHETPIFYAVKNGCFDITKLLLANGALIKDNFIETFNNAVIMENFDLVELILQMDSNFNVNATDCFGRTPLLCTVFVKGDELMHSYCDQRRVHSSSLAGLKSTNTNLGNRKLMFYSSNVKNDDMRNALAKLLLKRGANVDIKLNLGIEFVGCTPLFAACKNGFIKVVETLLEYNANMNITWNGISPLLIAAFKGHAGITEILLKSGCDYNFKDCFGRTALHLACEKEHKEVVNVFIGFISRIHETKCKSDLPSLYFIDNKDDDGCTPFMIAVKKGSKAMAEILFNAGAGINCANNCGETALHLASVNRHYHLIEMLLKFGCDINKLSKTGRTALEYAEESLSVFPNDYNFYDSDRFDIGDYHTAVVVLNIFNSHMIKLMAANLYECSNLRQVKSIDIVSYSNSANLSEKFIDYKYHYYSFNECKIELTSMKDNYIINNLSYYDIVTKNIYQLAVYVRNPVVLQSFNASEYKSLYPIYSDIIYCQFNLMIKRNDLLLKCEMCLLTVNSVLSRLPHLCLEKVLNYLTDEQLKAVIVACRL